MGKITYEFCHNIDNTDIKHILVLKNLKVVKELIKSNMCNIYTLDNNSLIIECRNNKEEFYKLQEICRTVKGFEESQLLFANPKNYTDFITI
ncbi:hypothetical protein [Clostridium sporogenes]|uniref:hypothetical protein n=1 Tax=Clostridium sporogenes TaxID=1509 RepID=UPI0013CFB6A8|nr:hypothetical protein [Clostridium sporogenes]NFH40738.1 hypothetical protein [Clostridium sporogenes]